MSSRRVIRGLGAPKPSQDFLITAFSRNPSTNGMTGVNHSVTITKWRRTKFNPQSNHSQPPEFPTLSAARYELPNAVRASFELPNVFLCNHKHPTAPIRPPHHTISHQSCFRDSLFCNFCTTFLHRTLLFCRGQRWELANVFNTIPLGLDLTHSCLVLTPSAGRPNSQRCLRSELELSALCGGRNGVICGGAALKCRKGE